MKRLLEFPSFKALQDHRTWDQTTKGRADRLVRGTAGPELKSQGTHLRSRDEGRTYEDAAASG